MNKAIKLVLLIILVLGVVAVVLFLLFGKKPKSVDYSLPLNSFYKDKVSQLKKPPQKNENYREPNILASSAVLIESDTKYPLYEKNDEGQVPIASITKIMTAQITLDIYKPDEIVEIKPEYISVEGSKVGFKPGEKFTVENLLYGLLVVSGNDAAEALAGAKVPRAEFIGLMNKKASSLNLKSTYFRDPAGLDDEGHSSAIDVALLFSNGLQNSLFETVISTNEKKISASGSDNSYELKNSNRLTTGEIPLEGNIGGKTGNTPAAGHALVSAATRNGTTLICVILKTDSDSKSASAEEARKLLNWGFDSFAFSQN